MKIRRPVILGLLALVLPWVCPAYQSGPYTYTLTTNGQATITGFDQGYTGSLTITNRLGGAPVTSFGGSAFAHCGGLKYMYCSGKALGLGDDPFGNCPNLTLYYLPHATNGWTCPYGERPAVLWNPTFRTADHAEGVVACAVTGTPAIPVAWETSTNLTLGSWLRLQTTNLVGGVFRFTHPDATNVPARFYRVVGPQFSRRAWRICT